MTLLDRMVLAVERVRDRLARATAALDAAEIPYAVAGSSAVAAWIATIDDAAVRNTRDVDILLRHSDLESAAGALESAGFIHHHVDGSETFLDGLDAKPRDAVRIIIAGEKLRPEHDTKAPDVTESHDLNGIRVLTIDGLVRMKTTSFLLNDRVDLQDMLEVGLIDQSWVPRLPPTLAARLQHLINTPEQ